MSPLWENLDKIGIVIGIIVGIVEVGQWFFLLQLHNSVEEIEEDIDDISEEMDSEAG